MNNTIIKNKHNDDFTVESSYETCVVCDKQTNVPVDLHVDYRNYYIDGAGQLCEECFFRLDNKKYITIGH